MPSPLRDHFLIRSDVTYLNHGAFGAVPRAVLHEQQRWQAAIEEQPTEMIRRLAPELRSRSLQALARYVGADANDLVYVATATVGVNIVARSLKLDPGDVVLATDHEFGACERAWRTICRLSGAIYHPVHIPVPVETHEDVLERLFDQVTLSTKVLFISHITSSTALTFPVVEVCRRARALGIITIVDGSHAPGQVPLDLDLIGADFYIGILHKWLCGPKGTVFLHVRRSMQVDMEPFVYGWDRDPSGLEESILSARYENIGTIDLSAVLAVPAAIEFHHRHNWSRVRAECNDLLRRARPLVAESLHAEPVAPDTAEWFMQMSSFLLPADVDGERLQRYLYEEHRVEVPVLPWNGRQMLRVSIQGYNAWNDIERLLGGLDAWRATPHPASLSSRAIPPSS